MNGEAISSLCYAVVSAVQHDLAPMKVPIFEYRREKGKAGTERVDTGKTRDVRPSESGCFIYHFPQTWSSTALGFGGIGGQAFTSAYTTVVLGPQGDACVYFGGRLAYHIIKPTDAFREDIESMRMAEVASAAKYEQEPHQP